ncbi:2'-5' RNA ligase family protein [Terricaulis sp.]|uniref:2'-5' RNA ligase family protein n=1 Tax=Terricaulis sp. TaxID=2768686 RepID=UPI0037837A84
MTAPASPRRQLSLFVPAPHAAALEAARAVLDPIQHSLIPAHVTACRDAETHALPTEELDRRIAAAGSGPITLAFGRAVAFDGHGILLPCIGGEAALAAFRARLLGPAHPRREAPHITLAHPRNPKAVGNELAVALNLPERIEISFAEAALIEQAPGEIWRVLRRFRLG